MKAFDLVIKNARLVRPNTTGVDVLDIATKDGKVVWFELPIRSPGQGR